MHNINTKCQKIVSNDYLLCAECGLRSSINYQATNENLYENIDNDVSYKDIYSNPPRIQQKIIINHMLNNHKLKKLYDFGSGSGNLKRLIPNDWVYVGFDPSKMAIEYSELHDAKIVDVKLFGDYLHSNNEPVVVAVFDVLEHLDDPCRFILNLKRDLPTGSLIIGTVPNDNRILVFGIREKWDEEPHHIHFFNPISVRKMLLKLEPKNICINNIFIWKQNFDYFCNFVNKSTTTKNRFIKCLYSIIISPLFLINYIYRLFFKRQNLYRSIGFICEI